MSEPGPQDASSASDGGPHVAAADVSYRHVTSEVDKAFGARKSGMVSPSLPGTAVSAYTLPRGGAGGTVPGIPAPVATASTPAAAAAGKRLLTIRRTHYGERMGLAFDDDTCETKVTEVWDGPCKAAGVEPGMIITAVNNMPVTSLSEIPTTINTAPLDFVMEVDVLATAADRQVSLYSPPLPKVPSRWMLEEHSAREDEAQQLKLQLEAASLQMKSMQARANSAAEREKELTADLLREKEKTRALETRHAQELLRQEQKVLETVRQNEVLRTEMLQHFEKQRMEEETGFEVKYKTLLQQYEDDKVEWRMARIDLEQRLAAMTRKTREVNVMQRELEGLRHFVKTGEVLESAALPAAVEARLARSPSAPQTFVAVSRESLANEARVQDSQRMVSPTRASPLLSVGRCATPSGGRPALPSPRSASRSVVETTRLRNLSPVPGVRHASPSAVVVLAGSPPRGIVSAGDSFPVRSVSIGREPVKHVDVDVRTAHAGQPISGFNATSVDSVLERARSLRERRMECAVFPKAAARMHAATPDAASPSPGTVRESSEGRGVTISEIDREREAEELQAALAAIARARRREL